MVKTKKTKGRTFAKKSIAQIRRPVVWLWGFNPLRRIPKAEMDSFSNPLPNTGLNLNVMSFNIRRGTKKDGKNHWIFRRDRVCELLNHYRPDVLGLQEALDFQISEISAMLPGYEKVGMGNLGGSKGLHKAIFYDAARFVPSAEGTFWFSDTPDIPGSKGWGNIIPRTCTWARLIEKDSEQAFYFYNVHLDHLSRRSRKNSVVFLTQFIHMRSSPDPFVLTGDFNARERSTPIKYLKGKIPLKIKTKGNVSQSRTINGHLSGTISKCSTCRYLSRVSQIIFSGSNLTIFLSPLLSGSRMRKLFNRNGKNITLPTISRCLPILICL